MTVYNDNEIIIDLKDIVLLGFSGLIIIFANLFQKTWMQKEKMFCYFWGMENYLNNEPNNDFKSDHSIDFLFGTKIKVMKRNKFIFRNILSYIILWMVIIIRLISLPENFIIYDFFPACTIHRFIKNQLDRMNQVTVEPLQIIRLQFFSIFHNRCTHMLLKIFL